MDDKATMLEKLQEKAERYAKISIELLKLKAIEKTADVVASMASRVTVIIFFAFFVLILNIGLALWIGDLLGRSYLGFFVLAAFYLLTGLIVKAFRHQWIKKPVINYFITQVHKPTNIAE